MRAALRKEIADVIRSATLILNLYLLSHDKVSNADDKYFQPCRVNCN